MLIDDDDAETLTLALMELPLVDYPVLVLASSLALLLPLDDLALEPHFPQLALSNHGQDDAGGDLALLH